MGHQPSPIWFTEQEIPWWFPPPWCDCREQWIAAAEEVAACCGERIPHRPLERWRLVTGRMGRPMYEHRPPPPRRGLGYSDVKAIVESASPVTGPPLPRGPILIQDC